MLYYSGYAPIVILKCTRIFTFFVKKMRFAKKLKIYVSLEKTNDPFIYVSNKKKKIIIGILVRFDTCYTISLYVIDDR